MEARLHAANVHTMTDLMALTQDQMRRIWRSVEGARLHLRLRGVEIPDPVSRTNNMWHGHVLPPEMRPPWLAEIIARRLLLKVACRLRRGEMFARRMEVKVAVERGPSYKATRTFPLTADSGTLMKHMVSLWEELTTPIWPSRIMQVHVQVMELVPAVQMNQLELFPATPPTAGKGEQPGLKLRLSQAMDECNQKLGRDAVTMGLMPGDGSSFTGLKIAFTRVPQRWEFRQ